MIQKLVFGEPFFDTAFIEAEERVRIEGCCLLFNACREGGEAITVSDPAGARSFTIAPLRCAVVKDTDVCVPGRALLIKNFGLPDLDDQLTYDLMCRIWPSERPFHKSVKISPAEGVHFNFVLVDRPNCPSGIHRTHDRELDELHVQVCGNAAVDVMASDDPNSTLASLSLAPGSTHDALWDADGVYPWHRYRSLTRSVFLCVELDR